MNPVIKQTMTMVIFAMTTTLAFAGPRITGNGGDAVVCRNTDQTLKSVELLDFYEGKQERGIVSNLNPQKTVQENVDILISRLGIAGQYLQQDLNKLSASFMSESKLFSDITLVDIQDSNHITIPNGCAVEQIAIQVEPKFPQDVRYKISKDLWDHMDNTNKAGLIVHEILYRFMIEKNPGLVEINSTNVRYINSLLSADQLKKLSLYNFEKYVAKPLGSEFISYEGYKVAWNQLHQNEKSVQSFCGLAQTKKIVTFSGDLPLTIPLEKDAKLCHDRALRTYDIQINKEIHGHFGNQEFLVPENSELSIEVDHSKNVVALKNIYLMLKANIYSTNSILCDQVKKVVGEPEMFICSVENNANHVMIGLFNLYSYFKGVTSVEFTIKNGVFSNLKYQYDSGIWGQGVGERKIDFYPSGYIKSASMGIGGRVLNRSVIAIRVLNDQYGGFDFDTIHSNEAAQAPDVEFYDKPGMFGKKLLNASTLIEVPVFQIDKTISYGENRGFTKLTGIPLSDSFGNQTYENGQVKQLKIVKIENHYDEKQYKFVNTKQGNKEQLTDDCIITFDPNGQVVSVVK